MDFDKLAKMIDELNENFGIIEQDTKVQEEAQLEDYKKLFWAAYEYINNFYKLFEKVAIREYHTIYIYINENHSSSNYLTIHYGNGYARGDVEFGFHNYPTKAFTVLLGEPNVEWFNTYFFSRDVFKEEIIPFIKAFDYGYMEKQFADKLNEAITKKAEYVERRYNKAKER